MNDLQTLVTTLGKVISGIYGAATGNLLALVGVVGPLLSLKSVNFSLLLPELKALSATDRQALELTFEQSLSLPANVQDKVDSLVNSLEDLVVLVAQAIDIVKGAEALIAQVRKVLGV